MLTDHTNVMVKKKDCQIRHLPLDKSHFITEILDMAVTEIDVFGIYFFGIYVSEELWFDIV